MTHPIEAHQHSDPSLLYSLSKPVLGYIDRQSAVSSKTRLTFPDSAVGRIQFKEKIKNNSLNGTGFLISPTLVLTASHNFIRNVDNAILQFDPFTFSILPQGDNQTEQITRKVKAVIVNPKFMNMFREISTLKKLHRSEKDKTIKQKHITKKMALEEQSIQQDFALLKLKYPIERAHYFQLFSPPTPPAKKRQFVVTGYRKAAELPSQLFETAKLPNFYNFKQDNKEQLEHNNSDEEEELWNWPVHIPTANSKAVAINQPEDLIKLTVITESGFSTLRLWALQMNDFLEKHEDPIQLTNDPKGKDYKHSEQSLLEEEMPGQYNISQINLQHFILRQFTANDLTDIQSDQDQKEQANEQYPMAADTRIEQIQCPQALKKMGMMHDFQEKTAQAIECYNKAIVIYIKRGEQSIEFADTLNKIGSAYQKIGKLKQTLEFYNRALTIQQKLGTQSIKRAMTIKNIEQVSSKMDKFKQIPEYFHGASLHQIIQKWPMQQTVTVKEIVAYENEHKLQQALENSQNTLTMQSQREKEPIQLDKATQAISSLHQKIKLSVESIQKKVPMSKICFPVEESVKSNQLSTFPFNTIGQLKSMIIDKTTNKLTPIFKGTGFLISPNLVLTSCRNCISKDEKGYFQQDSLMQFSILETSEKYGTERTIKVKAYLLNYKFLIAIGGIKTFEDMYSAQQDNIQKQEYLTLLHKQQEKALKNDFALLKLQKTIERSHYFELSANTASLHELKLAESGYNVDNSDIRKSQMSTRSLTFDSTINREMQNYFKTEGPRGSPIYSPGDESKLVGIQNGSEPQKQIQFVTVITETVIDAVKRWLNQMDIPFISSSQGLIIQPVNKGDIGKTNEESNQTVRNQSKDLRLNLYQIHTVEQGLLVLHDPQWQDKQWKQLTSYRFLQQEDYTRDQQLQRFAESYEENNKADLQQGDQTKIIQFLNYCTSSPTKDTTILYKSREWAIKFCNFGSVYLKKGNLIKALQYYDKALTIYKNIGEESIQMADTLNSIGITYRLQDNFQTSLEFYQKALTIYKNIKQESIQIANTYNNIGVTYQSQGSIQKALEYYQKAMLIYQKLNTSIDQANTLSNIGLLYHGNNKSKQALEYYLRALKIYEKRRKASTQWADTLHHIALIFNSYGQINEQLSYFLKRQIISQKMHQETLGYATTLYNIGNIYHHQGKTQQYNRYYNKALVIFQKIGQLSVGWAHTLYSLGLMHQNNGKVEQALQKYNKAISMFEKMGQRQCGWANTLNNIGTLYHQQGRYTQAIELYRKSLDINQEIGIESINGAINLNNLSVAYKHSDKPQEAIEYHNRAFNIYRKIMENKIDGANVPHNIHNTSNLQTNKTEQQQAIIHYQRIIPKYQIVGNQSIQWTNTKIQALKDESSELNQRSQQEIQQANLCGANAVQHTGWVMRGNQQGAKGVRELINLEESQMQK